MQLTASERCPKQKKRKKNKIKKEIKLNPIYTTFKYIQLHFKIFLYTFIFYQ